MATWKKVIVSGSSAVLSSVSIGSNQSITTSPAGTYLSGSFSGSFYGGGIFTGTVNGTISSATSASVLQITDDQTSNSTRYITFVNLTSGYISQSIDSTGLTYNPSTNIITATASYASLSNTSSYALVTPWSGIINIPTGIISSSVLSAGVSQGQITYISNSLSNTITVTSLGSSDSPTFANLTISSNATINGNLIVNGTTTVVNTTNLEVKDKFILLNSGSNTGDGGIIIQSGSAGTGSAFYWESTENRWAVATGIASSDTSIIPNSYVVTVTGSAGIDPSIAPYYGNDTNKTNIGNIYVNTTSGDIWIYS